MKMNKNAEIVVFKDPCKSIKLESKLSEKKVTKRNYQEERKKMEMEMKKARHDVYKFAISGLTNDKKKNAKKNLAISLGAKPERRKYINYRTLLENKAKEKLNKN